ncbi:MULTISPECIES: dihydropteroate synthase [unclassified Campylobacter]|uniref:dihydropteroate synthase n=1 Tax=unclassified Campylobacter TaxID=2593542 RepID=UPI0012381C59|nr:MULTISPECIES: dihydropteroate synthase [unclassified Campylobacter]KAA6226364.1 dihydropteroate synthase [Campylobacter sp. LR286c]KAA6226598.1 dihydropteroate synthase [Campylobacter sp. LR185c]KAA6226856.1 dihydropteroate synthase [Campylobacter sp. LR196d]KAA6230293.1 dihydropteroate synthase [Campylobacter sp. LR291e]KAA6233814.1 dihydropteroate synthase [Campylobacter sp. LR264d]
MIFYKLNEESDFNLLCEFIKPHKMGQEIMSKKTKTHFIFIKDISCSAANILKQDSLRVGAELVTNKDIISCCKENTNALLLANEEQILKLIQKEKKQDFKLKNLALFLQSHFSNSNTNLKSPRLMAIININEDSFNADSRVSEKAFEKRLISFLELKPEFIDIGAVSSRPGSLYCGEKEEFKRLKNCLDLIYKKNYYKESNFSLDSFNEYCLEYALNKGFNLINDITGLKNENLAKLAQNYKASYCLMHMQNDPLTMQENPYYNDLISEINDFFGEKLEILAKYKIKEVILDVGIGFGKSPVHNMLLIKHLGHFLHFNKPLLIGASRKSVINAYFKSEVKERLAGTLYLHLQAFKNGANIIRVHDLYEHKQMFALNLAMGELIL